MLEDIDDLIDGRFLDSRLLYRNKLNVTTLPGIQ
jgi:hypothetical protein